MKINISIEPAAERKLIRLYANNLTEQENTDLPQCSICKDKIFTPTVHRTHVRIGKLPLQYVFLCEQCKQDLLEINKDFQTSN